jgi:hypothetical protein
MASTGIGQSPITAGEHGRCDLLWRWLLIGEIEEDNTVMFPPQHSLFNGIVLRPKRQIASIVVKKRRVYLVLRRLSSSCY